MRAARCSILNERLPSGRFAPGVSGNPAGRPRLPVEFRETVTRLAAGAADVLAQLLDGEIAAPVAVRARVALGLLALGVSRASEPDAEPPPPVMIVQAADPVAPELWEALAARLFGLSSELADLDLAGTDRRTVTDAAALLAWVAEGDLATVAAIRAVPWDATARQLAWGWSPDKTPDARHDARAEQD